MLNQIKPLRIALILLLQFTFLAVFSQQKLAGTFVLKGDLSNYLTPAGNMQVTIRKPAGGFLFDSIPVVNNQFEYRLELREPCIVLLTIRPARTASPSTGAQRGGGTQDYISIYAYPSVNQLKLVDGKLSTAVIEGEGAKSYLEYKKLYDEFSLVSMSAAAVISKRGITDRAVMTIIRDSLTAVADETVLKPYIAAHPKSIVSIWAMLEYAARPYWSPRKNLEPDRVNSLLSPMSAAFKQLPAMTMLGQSVQTALKTKPGKQAMDFTLLDTAGKAVKLSDFKGKIVFLDFWASWCVPCRKENPNVLKQYAKYKDKGLVVLSVSLDNQDKRAEWLKAISDDAINAFVHVSELKGFASKPAVLYDIKSIPTNFIIDAEGKFIARNIYAEQLNIKLAEIFNKTTPKTK